MESDLFSVLVSNPFFSRLGTPQNRYHKLFQRQNGSVLGSKRGPKQAPTSGLVFVSSFCPFRDFLHTTSSAYRRAPAISKPHFRLSSFLLFLLSLRSFFRRLFGQNWVPKPSPKRNPKLDPSKRRARPKKKSNVPKMGPKSYSKRGPCGVLSSFLLRCCFLLDFGAFRAYFGQSFIPTSEFRALIFLCFLGSGFTSGGEIPCSKTRFLR